MSRKTPTSTAHMNLADITVSKQDLIIIIDIVALAAKEENITKVTYENMFYFHYSTSLLTAL